MKPSTETKLYFYQNGKLMTVRESLNTRTVFRAWLRPLAEKNTGSTSPTALLITDENNSALGISTHDHLEHHAYSPYGHTSTPPLSRALTKFNGEHLESTTHHYLLGNGYRAFSPSLMRFYSPDSWSPFRAGGINAYMYCGGDPINHTDSSGHMIRAKPKTRTTAQDPLIFKSSAETNESLAHFIHRYANATREKNKAKTSSPANRLNLPSYEARASQDQFTLDITLKGRDTTSFLSKADYEAGLEAITKKFHEAGIDPNGLLLKGGGTGTTPEQNSIFHNLTLDAIALDVRHRWTARWLEAMKAEQQRLQNAQQ